MDSGISDMAVIDDVIGAGMDWNEEVAQRFAA